MKFSHLPVIPLRITSHFGKRSTGIRGSSSDHKGVDLGRDRTKSETSLYLVKDGRCLMNGWNDYRGWYVEFDIGQGYTVLYQHLKSKSPCRIAQMYESGSIIGIMGNSSDKSKLDIVTHLHFEVRKLGIPINPEPFLYDLEKYEMITQTKILINGQEKTVNRILKDGENYIRLRDIEDVLKVADVEYDEAKKDAKGGGLMGYFETSLKCINQRKFVNIPAWHEHGFTGKGLTIFHDDLGETSHNACCKDIIQTILPDARVLSGHITWVISRSLITECHIECNETGERLPFEDFILKYDVSQINNSTGAGDNGDNLETPQSRYFREMIEKHNLFCTGSAGNYKGMTNKYQGAFVLVSGAYLMSDGSITDYGSEGEPVDFSMFMGYQSGTSFSSPFLNGMAGLVRCKYGRITQAEIYDYFKNHCKDLGEPGDDVEYGWGLPILGRPEMKIVMQIGKHRALVEGKEVLLDQAPVIDKVSNRTLTPARFVAEALGAKVTWNAEDKTIVIER